MAQNAADKTAGKAIQVPMQQTGSTLYALNENGENLFSMQVQPGFVIEDGVRRQLTEDECQLIAACMYSAVRFAFGSFWRK